MYCFETALNLLKAACLLTSLLMLLRVRVKQRVLDLADVLMNLVTRNVY